MAMIMAIARPRQPIRMLSHANSPMRWRKAGEKSGWENPSQRLRAFRAAPASKNVPGETWLMCALHAQSSRVTTQVIRRGRSHAFRERRGSPCVELSPFTASLVERVQDRVVYVFRGGIQNDPSLTKPDDPVYLGEDLAEVMGAKEKGGTSLSGLLDQERGNFGSGCRVQ
jgi:hypothetical protein